MSVPGVQRWFHAQAVLWLLFLVGAVGTPIEAGSGRWVFAAAPILAGGSYLALWGILRAGRRAADWVTLARFAGFQALFVAVVLTGTLTWALWTGLVVVVLLDLADGWVARRYGGSRAGAILDMEADQLVTLGLALLACGYAGVGIWILLLPGFKYGYVLWTGILRLPFHDPRPMHGENRRAKTICAVVMVILLTCTVPVLPAVVRSVTGWIAVVLLAYSFGRDAWFLTRQRRDSASARV
jgi:phosphatidylglycerophosphate synthase